MTHIDNFSIHKSSGTNLNQYQDSNNNKNFNPNFYNPFEIKHRRRTSRGQFKILEKAFINNPKPNGKIRQGLAESLSMTPRGVQVWFQNRRAKEKQVNNRIKKDSNPPKQYQQQYQQQHNLNCIPIQLSASNMIHSKSQSSSSSSTNKPWISDNSTVNDDDDEDLTAINTPPNNQSSQIPLEDDNEWWMNHGANMMPFINHQTTAVEIKPDPNTTQTITTAADNAANLSAWPTTTCNNYFNQLFLTMTNMNTIASHECAMRSLPNNNVADWIQSTQIINDNLLLDDLLVDDGNKSMNMYRKRYSYPLPMPLQQDETYWTGQQVTLEGFICISCANNSSN